MHPKMSEIFGKVTAAELKSNFGGPAGGSALERASPPMAGKKSREIIMCFINVATAIAKADCSFSWTCPFLV